jgi:hypothetical protein
MEYQQKLKTCIFFTPFLTFLHVCILFTFSIGERTLVCRTVPRPLRKPDSRHHHYVRRNSCISLGPKNGRELT